MDMKLTHVHILFFGKQNVKPLRREKANLQKLDILIHGEPVDALSIICHMDDAYHRGVALCSKLKELIPRQMFEVAIQASLNQRIIARTTIRALKKNVRLHNTLQ